MDKIEKTMMWVIMIITIVGLSASFVSSAPPASLPISSSEGSGLQIETPYYDSVKTLESHRFHLHLINSSTIVTNESATCQIHLYNQTGWDIYADFMEFEGYNGIDFATTIEGGNFSTEGNYPIVFTCNTSNQAGFYAININVNEAGAILSIAEATTFNYAMIFLMILWILAVIGMFSLENPQGKLASYWVAHLLFIAGTFSIWQFNSGYITPFEGLVGTFKILFYVSITALIPALFFSFAYYWYAVSQSNEIQQYMNKGMEFEEAESRAKRKKKW